MKVRPLLFHQFRRLFLTLLIAYTLATLALILLVVGSLETALSIADLTRNIAIFT